MIQQFSTLYQSIGDWHEVVRIPLAMLSKGRTRSAVIRDDDDDDDKEEEEEANKNKTRDFFHSDTHSCNRYVEIVILLLDFCEIKSSFKQTLKVQ